MQCGLLLTAIGTLAFCIHGALLSELPASRTPGYLDFDNLPETNFTCEGKVIGGYYADIETGCQMFHVCTIGQRGDMTDIKFLCLNGTVFEQETRVCERVDEVDCSRSEDFYDLNLELYHSAGILPEDESESQDIKKEPESISEETDEAIYDESYELDTEEPPQTTIKTTTTTTTTTPKPTTTPKTTPAYTSAKPAFSIVLPSLKNKNTGTHLTGLIPTYTQKNVVPTLMTPISSAPPNYNENRNVGTHLTGFVPGTSQSPRPFGLPPAPSQPSQQPPQQQFTYESPVVYGKAPATLDTGLKPPPTSYHLYPGQPTSSLKPPGYDNYKNYYPSSSPSPPMLVHDYGHKTHQHHQQEHQKHLQTHQRQQEQHQRNQEQHQRNQEQHQRQQEQQQLRQQEQQEQKRPLSVVLSHHFPALPTKSSYDDFSIFTSPGSSFVRYNSNKAVRPTHKPNPTILALQSQQKKVHKLHQEGLEHAEHQIAQTKVSFLQVASRNAEISNLQSQQQDETARSYDTDTDHTGSRETKEIHASNSPAIAIVTSTSSTSSARIQKQPITSYVKTVTDEKGGTVSQQVYSATPGLQTELEKLFKNEPKKEENTDMDLEQLLLAWKLKTNQEVTKGDIEKVFLSLDLSKFKNGETISLSDIFKLMNASDANHTTRTPPTTYDEYTEEDVPFDPFFKDVPKVGPRSKRDSNVQIVSVTDNGRFRSHGETRRSRGRSGTETVKFADVREIDSESGRLENVPADIVIKSSSREPMAMKVSDIEEMTGSVEIGGIERSEEIVVQGGRTRNVHIVSAGGAAKSSQLRKRDKPEMALNNIPSTEIAVTRRVGRPRALPLNVAIEPIRERPSSQQRGGRIMVTNNDDEPTGRRGRVRVRKLGRRKEVEAATEEDIVAGEEERITTTTTTTPRPYPKTSFTCRDKIAGGFYADTEADCQFFHICSDLGDGNLRDNPFFCGPGTRFNQRSRTCQADDLVDCSLSLRYYSLNENFRIPAEEPIPMVPLFEPTKLDRRKG